MINANLDYIAFIVAVILMLRLAYDFIPSKAVPFIPLVLIIYLSFMMLGANNIFAHNVAIENTYNKYMSWLPPMMIFLMLLQFKLTFFKKLGKKMIFTFFATTLSIIFAFVTVAYAFKAYLFAGSNAYFSVLAGSWSGGTANMLAVAAAIELPKSAMGTIIAVDSILYAFWLLFLLALVPFSSIFNRITKAEENLDILIDTPQNPTLIQRKWSLPLLLISSYVTTYLILELVDILPKTALLTDSFLTIILATLAGVIGSFTRLSTFAHSDEIAKYLLYFIIALIASKANYNGVASFGLFMIAGALILLIHALFMFAVAKLFKLDLFSVGIASLSHIGGIASAPILASAYHRSLVPVGVAMATMGYLLGTVVGLSIAWILGVI